MGQHLRDVFRPKWKHSKWYVRQAAAEKLTDQPLAQAVHADIAKNAVRRVSSSPRLEGRLSVASWSMIPPAVAFLVAIGCGSTSSTTILDQAALRGVKRVAIASVVYDGHDGGLDKKTPLAKLLCEEHARILLSRMASVPYHWRDLKEVAQAEGSLAMGQDADTYSSLTEVSCVDGLAALPEKGGGRLQQAGRHAEGGRFAHDPVFLLAPLHDKSRVKNKGYGEIPGRGRDRTPEM